MHGPRAKRAKTLRDSSEALYCKGKRLDAVRAKTRHGTGKKGQKLLQGGLRNLCRVVKVQSLTITGTVCPCCRLFSRFFRTDCRVRAAGGIPNRTSSASIPGTAQAKRGKNQPGWIEQSVSDDEVPSPEDSGNANCRISEHEKPPAV